MLRTRTLALAGLLTCLAVAGTTYGRGDGEKDGYNLIYVPTPQNAVEKMLDMAKVSDKDVVFDLGCGDGRIVATAATAASSPPPPRSSRRRASASTSTRRASRTRTLPSRSSASRSSSRSARATP
jgi:hypothetical protein